MTPNIGLAAVDIPDSRQQPAIRPFATALGWRYGRLAEHQSSLQHLHRHHSSCVAQLQSGEISMFVTLMHGIT